MIGSIFGQLKHYWSNIILDFQLRRSFWIKVLGILGWILIVFIYILFIFNVFQREPKLNKYQKEFNDLSDKYLIGKNIYSVNTSDLRIIFNSINRKSDGALLKYGYISTLEDYLVHITTDDNEKNDKFYKFIFTALENEKKQEPYSNLPNEERRILVSLEASIKSHETQIALLNLSSLNDVLKMENEHREKIEKQNRWAIPLAIVGLIVTILFGIITIFRPRQLKREKNLPKKV